MTMQTGNAIRRDRHIGATKQTLARLFDLPITRVEQILKAKNIQPSGVYGKIFHVDTFERVVFAQNVKENNSFEGKVTDEYIEALKRRAPTRTLG